MFYYEPKHMLHWITVIGNSCGGFCARANRSTTFWLFRYGKHGKGNLISSSERVEPPPRVDHLDVMARLTPSKNGNQEFTKRTHLNTPTLNAQT
jgi:hypothetical protein